jgi:hypothetical protein
MKIKRRVHDNQIIIMEKEATHLFESKEARNKHVSKLAKQDARNFYSNLSAMDLVDVYMIKSKSYKVGKIIEKHKKGFFILLDGYGESLNEENVSRLIFLNLQSF